MNNRKCRLFLIVAMLILLANNALANEYLFYKELDLIGGYSRQKGWIGKTNALSNSIGFEHFAKFSNDYGDYLTTDIQARFAYDSSQKFDQAWSVEFHNAWAEHRVNDALKVKIGHMEPAFGLEQVIDVHSTILQTLAMEDIGYTRDWGLGLRGTFPEFDYWVALGLGSGMSIRRIDSSYAVTARVGTPANRDFQYGISGLIGNILETEGMSSFPKNHLLSNQSVLKERIGFDCQYNWRSFLLKTEAVYGINDNSNVTGYLAEVDYTPPKSLNWQCEAQYQSFYNDLSLSGTDDSTASIGLTYKLSQTVTLRCAFTHDINRYNQERDTQFVVQFYFYGK